MLLKCMFSTYVGEVYKDRSGMFVQRKAAPRDDSVSCLVVKKTYGQYQC